jgi:ribosomal protein S27AE
MPLKQKINLEKVKAALNTLCPKCGYSIAPDRIRRIDFEQLECPECGQRFTPGEKLAVKSASNLGETKDTGDHCWDLRSRLTAT